VRSDHTDTDTTSQGAQAMRLLLERDPKPDGVFCFNDPLAIGAMSTILESGMRIPEDIALIGCGDLPNNTWLQVPLSSIDQHSQMIGQRAAELVLSLIESKPMPRTRTIILEPTLVVRSSTQRKWRPIMRPWSRIRAWAGHAAKKIISLIENSGEQIEEGEGEQSSAPLLSVEGPVFQFRVESFNTFNHTQFLTIDAGYTDATFGQVTAAQDPRVLQFGAKFLF
jgi:hypothetical protein